MKQWDINTLINELKANGKIMARPNQTLAIHIGNMLRELNEYFSYLPPFPKYGNLLFLGSIITVFSHDFGKFNPFFQLRLAKNIRSADLLILSRHSNIGALFAYFLTDSLIKELKKQFPNLFNKDEEDLHGFLKYITAIIVNNHHSKELKRRFNIIDENELEQLTFSLRNTFRLITNSDEGSLEPSWILIDYIEKIFSISGNITNKNGVKITEQNIKIATKEALNNLHRTIFNDSDSDPMFAVDNILLWSEELEEWLEYPEFDLDRAVEIYIIIGFLSSLLFDLDIWDARFYEEEKGHRFKFFNILKQIEINTDIVRGYVSRPFGEITPETLLEYRPPSNQQPIQCLRTTLFQNVDKEKIKAGSVYLINSPTGAGKTLTLLHAAFKAYKGYFDKGYKPKIIYGLPFISIGIQVADQIRHLIYEYFKKCKGKEINIEIGNQIICEDNYLVEHKWHDYPEVGEIQDDETPYITGNDARWLIESWHSQFIVTTFVKIFNSLLKPKKRNLMRFHRMVQSIIILDEIQCIPIRYWRLCRAVIGKLSEILGCTVFLSTATLPRIISPRTAVHLAKSHLNQICRNLGSNKPIGSIINRYILIYYREILEFNSFIKQLIAYLNRHPEDILIVLNTRDSVIRCYNQLANTLDLKQNEIIVLSTLVLPEDRRIYIDYIKRCLRQKNRDKNNRRRLIVIATQLIEAGVDVSFKIVIRDAAPLDSIIQIAGRCNRNMEYEKGYIHIVKILHEGKKIPDMNLVYKVTDLPRILDEFFFNFTRKNSEIRPQKFADLLITNLKSNDQIAVADELELRNVLENYYNEIIETNITNNLIKEMKSLELKSLAKKFDLIEELRNDIYLLPLISDKARKIHNQILDLLNNRKLKSHRLPTEFYLQVITIPRKWIGRLKSIGLNIRIVYDLENQPLYYYIENENIWKKIYNNKNRKIGLIIPEDNIF